MKLSSHPIRDGTIATVLGGVLLAALGKVVGIVPQAWNGIVAVLSMAWSALSHSVTVSLPVWGWTLALLTLISVWRVLHARSAAQDTNVQSDVIVTSADDELTGLDLEVMRLFARRDGRPLTLEDVVAQLSTNRLRASKSLELLEQRHLLDIEENYMHGARYHLTGGGRDYLIERGLA